MKFNELIINYLVQAQYQLLSKLVEYQVYTEYLACLQKMCSSKIVKFFSQSLHFVIIIFNCKLHFAGWNDFLKKITPLIIIIIYQLSLVTSLVSLKCVLSNASCYFQEFFMILVTFHTFFAVTYVFFDKCHLISVFVKKL